MAVDPNAELMAGATYAQLVEVRATIAEAAGSSCARTRPGRTPIIIVPRYQNRVRTR